MSKKTQTIILSLYAATMALMLVLLTGKALAGNAGAGNFPDFLIFYNVGKMVLSGEHYNIYDPAAQLKFFNEAMAPLHSNEVFFCQSPPFFFVAMSVLARLPYVVAFKLWQIASVVAATASLWLLARHRSGWNVWHFAMLICGAIVSFPGCIALLVGQTSWFILTLFALFYWSLSSRRQVICGIVIAISAIKLQYLPFLIAIVFACRRWRTLASFAVSMLVLLSISALVCGLDNVLMYPQLLFNAETAPNYAGVWPAFMVSLRGPLSVLLPPALALKLASLLTLVGAAGIAWIWLKARDADAATQDFAMAASVLVSLIASAHTHIYDCLLLCLPVVLTLKSAKTQPLAPAGYKIWQALLFVYPVLSWNLVLIPIPMSVIYRLPATGVNILLLILAIAICRQLLAGKRADINEI